MTTTASSKSEPVQGEAEKIDKEADEERFKDGGKPDAPGAKSPETPPPWYDHHNIPKDPGEPCPCKPGWLKFFEDVMHEPEHSGVGGKGQSDEEEAEINEKIATLAGIMENDAPIELPCPCNCGQMWTTVRFDFRMLKEEARRKAKDYRNRIKLKDEAK